MSANFEQAVADVAERREQEPKFQRIVVPEGAGLFVKWLCEEMNTKRISGYRLAKELDVSFGLISHWKNGRKIPKRTTVIALAKVFGQSYMFIEELIMLDVLGGGHE